MNNTKLSKILTIIAGVLGVISVIFFIRVIGAGDEALQNDADLQGSIVSPFVNYAVVLLYATGIITVVFSVLTLVKQPEKLKKTLFSVGALVVVVILAYATAGSSEVYDSSGIKVLAQAGSSVSKWVSALINTTFILGLVGIVFVALDFVKSLVK